MERLVNRKGNSFLIHAQMGVDKMTEGRWKWGTPFSTNASRMSKHAAVLIEDQVNTGRTPCLLRRNIRMHIELCRTKGKKGQGGRGKKEESKWDQPAPWREGAEAQGRDPCIHGHPLGWGSHLKLMGSELTNL